LCSDLVPVQGGHVEARTRGGALSDGSGCSRLRLEVQSGGDRSSLTECAESAALFDKGAARTNSSASGRVYENRAARFSL